MVEAVNTANQEAIQGSFAINEVKAAQDVLFSLVKAVKNYALFPENHTTSQQYLTSIKKRLDVFLNEFDSLRFDIKKGTFFYHDTLIAAGAKEIEELALQLYRDGVQLIEFEQGIALSEICLFIKIINKYKNIPHEDAEDDLVTALWSADLPHIHYEAADIFWDGEPLLDFASLHQPGQKSAVPVATVKTENKENIYSFDEGDQGEQKEEKNDEGAQSSQAKLQIQEVDPGLYSISDEEVAKLKHMVEKEEKNTAAHDAADVLLILLAGEDEEQSFLSSLDFFKEEFRNALSAKEFQYVVELLKKIYQLLPEQNSEKSWTRPFCKIFSGIFQVPAF